MFVFNLLRRVADFGNVGEYNYGASNDTKSEIQTAGYFNNAVRILEHGALLKVAGDADGTPWHSTYVVSNDGTNVTLTEAAAVTSNPKQIVRVGNMSTKASDAEVQRIVPGFAGNIGKISSVLNGALATGNATITVAINGVAVTNGVVTHTQAGSAAGNVATATPTAARTFTANDVITLTVGGASTATATAAPTVELIPS